LEECGLTEKLEEIEEKDKQEKEKSVSQNASSGGSSNNNENDGDKNSNENETTGKATGNCKTKSLRPVPKMIAVPSTRRVDHATGYRSEEMASFVGKAKYGTVPEFRIPDQNDGSC
jgi:hypothetical protein